VSQRKSFSWIKAALCWIMMVFSAIIINSASYASFNLEGIQVYPKANDPRGKKTKPADDLIRFRSADNLWDVLRSEFSLAHHENNPAVQENIDWLLNDQDFLLRTANRAAPYLYFIHQQVKKHHLPVELVLLPIIESGYNPFIYSTAGAAGIWQMMPDTASGFGVKQDWWYDGRRDVVASTRAALDYLSYLFNFFDGNSLLAIAAYNSGEGAVMSAIRRNIREGKSTDFWSLPLPRETRTYVPRLLALAAILEHSERYPLHFPAIRNAPYLAQVDVGGQIDLKRAALFAGMHLQKLQQLNPGFNRLVTHPNGPYKLVLPIENVERFMVNLSANTSLSHHIDWTQYKIKSGDTLESIAKRFNTTAHALQEINHLKRTAIKKGMKLVIPRMVTTVSNSNRKITNPDETLEKESLIENNSIMATNSASRSPQKRSAPNSTSIEVTSYVTQGIKSGDTVYMVRAKDTVEKIAERFKLSAKTIYAANKLHSYSVIHPGNQLLIPTHLAKEQEVNTKITVENQELRRLEPGDTLYMIRHGDTIQTIAQKFKTSSAAIRVANLMTDNSIREGEHIIVPTHLVGKMNQGRSLPLRLEA